MLCWKHPQILSDTSPLKSWIILANVTLITTIAIFSAITAMINTDSIIGGLGIDGALSIWINILILLGINTFVPVANRFADRYGYKTIFFLGVFLFGLGTLFTASAKNFMILGTGRFIEGAGAGFIFPVGLAAITRSFPKEKLGLAINFYLGVAFSIGMYTGTLVSGYIGQYLTWPLSFYMLLPFIFISLVICALFHDETELIQRGKFDFWGFLAFAIMIGSVLVGLSEGNLSSTNEGWRSPYIIGLLVLSFLSFILVIVIERSVKNPIIPLNIFKDFSFSLGCLVLFCIGLTLFSSIELMVSYMQLGLLYDKFMIGVVMMTYGLFFGIFSVVSSLLSKWITAPILSLIGVILLTMGLFLNNILSIQSGKVAMFFILFLKSAGTGFALGPMTLSSLQNLPKRLQTDGATLLTFFRQVGGTFGGSILGIILIRKNIFHRQLYMQTVNKQLPGYKYTFMRLQDHIVNAAGSNPQEAAKQAEVEIILNIQRQSHIQSINDSMLVIGYVFILITIMLICVNVISYLKAKKAQKELQV